MKHLHFLRLVWAPSLLLTNSMVSWFMASNITFCNSDHQKWGEWLEATNTHPNIPNPTPLQAWKIPWCHTLALALLEFHEVLWIGCRPSCTWEKDEEFDSVDAKVQRMDIFGKKPVDSVDCQNGRKKRLEMSASPRLSFGNTCKFNVFFCSGDADRSEKISCLKIQKGLLQQFTISLSFLLYP